MSIDWSRPIEAVHEDGRVVDATVHGASPSPANGCYWVMTEEWSCWVMPYDDQLGKGWRIRNIASPAPKYPEALVERMVAWFRRYASTVGEYAGMSKQVDEALAIVAELPAKVDDEWEEVMQLVEQRGVSRGDADWHIMTGLAEDALRRGRALADAGAGRRE